MLIVGLTGSIGMGKSTCAALFRAEGVAVHDSDATVHDLYAGTAAAPIEAAFPGVTVDGVVDRKALAKRVIADPAAFGRLEAIIHPLVAADRRKFLMQAFERGADIVVLDIPLLYETGSESQCDCVCLVTAPFDVQKQRVMQRKGMTEERFAAILARQMPDSDKRLRAHYLIRSETGLEDARRQIRALLQTLSTVEGTVWTPGSHGQTT